MRKQARHTPTPRTWPTETAYTARVGVRLPIALRDRLRAYVDATGQTISDALVTAVFEYLQKRGY